MTRRRIFYVTQGSLTVFAGDAVRPVEQFADNDEGLRRFARYLETYADVPSEILLDVIEEVFAVEAAPPLGIRDRQALLERRARRKFPRTPYRQAAYARAPGHGGDCTVVCSAVTNRELLDLWLEPIARFRVPLGGIRSVSLLGRPMLKRLFKTAGAVLLVTHHQGDKLRQIFLRDGHVQSARLSQSPPSTSSDYPVAVYGEVERSRRYLERSRLLGGMEELNVCFVGDARLVAKIEGRVATDAPLGFRVLDTAAAAGRLGLSAEPRKDRHEALFVAMTMRGGPRQSYARSGENRYHHMHRLRQSLIGAAMAASLACSILAGGFFAEAWLLAGQSERADLQVAQLTSALRRDNESYAPIHADSHEMKLAVDTGDYLLANRVPVAWTLQQLGTVLDDFPDVQVLELEWTVNGEGGDAAAPADSRRRQSGPLAVAPLASLDATVDAVLLGYDDDLRRAFARIDALAGAFGSQSDFDRVEVLRYPLNASPAAALSGEITRSAREEGARFRLGLSRAVAGPTENDHDGV